MTKITSLQCACGQVKLEVQGEPILVSECLCDSCRAAAAQLSTLASAPNLLTSYGATSSAEYRKDRIHTLAGAECLKEFKLTTQSSSRRVIATCCNTPVFLEMKGAHWLSLYLHLWPEESRPAPQLRTMVGDLSDSTALPQDIPNLKSHSLGFYAKLLGAWIAMGFKVPKFETKGTIDV